MKKILPVLAMVSLFPTFAAAISRDIDENEKINLSGIESIIFELSKPNCIICISTEKHYYSFSGTSEEELGLSLEGTLKNNNQKAVPRLITARKGRGLTVRIYEEQNLFLGLVESGSVHFYAEIPDSFKGKIEIITSSGDSSLYNMNVSELFVRSSSGDIDIVDITAENIDVKASSGKITADNIHAADEININASSGDISIVETASKNASIHASSGRISIEKITAKGEIDLAASSGRIIVDKLNGQEVKIDARSGKIILGSVSAEELQMDASSGDITVETLNCRAADIRSSSGGMTIGAGQGSIKYKGSSGKVEIGMTGLDGDLDITNSSGDVTLLLPAGAAFSADLEVNSGKIISDFRLLGDVSAINGNTVVGEANGGGSSVRIKASSGDIRIEER